jgi:uncharacterized YigZ family protein
VSHLLESYKTLLNPGNHEIDIKGSRFICHLQRVTTEEEALGIIQAVKKEHWKANHNCYAYVIGEQDQVQRASDDGEPSGTAGVPILEVLKKNQVHNVLAIVTRYFGGTKLGAGGLIRAYTQATATALSHLGIAECSLEQIVELTIQYTDMGKLDNYLAQEAITVLDRVFSDQVVFLCSIPISQVDTFQENVIDLLNNRLSIRLTDTHIVERPWQGD